MRIEEDVKLDFSDVLIRPKRSQAKSRQQVDLNREFHTIKGNPTDHGIPIIASNMDTVGSFDMARALAKHNVWTCLHKHYSIEELISFYNNEPGNVRNRTFYTMGVTDEDITKFWQVNDASNQPQYICIDVANGYSEYFVDRVKMIVDALKNTPTPRCVMAGNVCTPEMVQELIIGAGVNIIKVGIGGGSVCTTRLKSGVGYPQLSCVIECADAAHGLNALICSDGGCVHPGDVAKAFAAGSDFVMLGGMLAGTAECEGNWDYDYDEEGNSRKCSLKFYGMSSKEAMEKHAGGVAKYRTAEGKCVSIPYKGPVDGVILDILGGLRSACTYVGANRLKDLSKCTTFVKVRRTANECFS
jgi:GMP reductase